MLRILIFILYRILKSESRHSNVLIIWACTDTVKFNIYLSYEDVIKTNSACYCYHKVPNRLRLSKESNPKVKSLIWSKIEHIWDFMVGPVTSKNEIQK